MAAGKTGESVNACTVLTLATGSFGPCTSWEGRVVGWQDLGEPTSLRQHDRLCLFKKRN